MKNINNFKRIINDIIISKNKYLLAKAIIQIIIFVTINNILNKLKHFILYLTICIDKEKLILILFLYLFL